MNVELACKPDNLVDLIESWVSSAAGEWRAELFRWEGALTESWSEAVRVASEITK